jgi:hypothetical protein
LGNEHPVTERNIPEELSSQLHCFESLKTHKIYIFLIITAGSSCSSKPEQMTSGPILDYVCSVKTNKIQGSYGQLL